MGTKMILLSLNLFISFQPSDSEESMLRKPQRPTKDSKCQPDTEVSSGGGRNIQCCIFIWNLLKNNGGLKGRKMASFRAEKDMK